MPGSTTIEPVAEIKPNRMQTSDAKARESDEVNGFFRIEDLTSDMRDWVLPELGCRNDHLGWIKILSVGCSDGRDSYSMAILVEDFIHTRPDCAVDRYSLSACDTNPENIRIAELGCYGLEPDEIRRINGYQQYFHQNADSSVTIEEQIREHVDFRIRDIRTMESRERYDIIICTHRVLHYEQAYQRMIARELADMTADNGFIYIESMGDRMMQSLNLKPICTGSHFYRKTS